MTTTLALAPTVTVPSLRRSDDLPVGLSVDDAVRIAAALDAAHADSTRIIYAHTWRVWERWCTTRGIPALPADPSARRDHPARLRLSDARLQLVALYLGDVEFKPAGLLLTVRQSKTDQEGHGQVVAVAHGSHAATDPVAALAAWRKIRGDQPGALFTRIWASRISDQPLGNHVVARMLRERAVASGLDGTRITAHSLRAGHATSAAMAGVSLNRIAAQTRHKDLSVLVNRYIRPLEALATTSSKDLGL